MPFDYAEYQNKTSAMSTDQLQKEWENYTRQIAGGATSTATSVLFSPLTAGISLMGLGLSAPRIHNARKKRDIIEKGLQERGSTHNTRSRDVAGSMALSGAISVATLGLAGPLADAAAGEAVGKGVEYAVAHVALDGVGEVIEHKHGGHLKKKAEQDLKMKAMAAQLAGMSIQNGQQQQMMMANGQAQVMSGQWVNINGQMVYQQMPVMGGFQQPALTSAMALPQASTSMQNTQQIQWQQPNPSMQAPGMYQPQMQINTMQSEIVQDQYGQYTQVQSQQQYIQQPPQYQQPDQQFVQQDSKIQLNVIPSHMPQQQPDSKYHLHVIQDQQQPQMTATGFPNEKSAAYTTEYADGTMTPLPLYSEPEKQGHPTHIDLPAALTVEQEIEMLKFKLLALEMQKRGMSATISGPLEICLDPPESKEAANNTESPQAVVVQEVTTNTEVVVQSPPQAGQQQGAPQPTVHVETHVESQTQVVTQPIQRRDTLSAPSIPAGRPVSPAPQSQSPPAAQVQVQQYAQQQFSPNQYQQQPPQAQQYAPFTQQYSPVSQQYAPPQQYTQPVQTHQRQNSLVPPPIPAGRPVSPAPLRQNTRPPPAQQQSSPIYQPRPVNAALQAPPPPAANQQYVPVAQPQQQYANVNQQQYNPKNNYAPPPPAAQRQDSGYYSQAPSPMQRPVSSISSISSISSPVGRHPSVPTIPQYQPQPQQQHAQYNPAGYNPQSHGRSASVSSLTSPPPPPYFAPPPGAQQPVLAGKTPDYFNQGQPQGYGQWNQPQWQGHQQQMVPGTGNVEPNYGPPPAIPGRM